MRSLGTRRVAQAAGAAMVTVIALAGCSAGQVAETAMLKSPISGLNTESPDGDLLIRNLQVAYNSPTGYLPNASAPIEVALFNQTQREITVTISSRPQQDVVAGVVSAQAIGVGAPPAAAGSTEASAGPAPAAAPSPAKFTIPALGSETFLAGDNPALQAVGLSDKLLPGYSLAVTFQVEGEQPIDVLAPFQIPHEPASRGPVNEDENHESE
jgi:hypothetical protein